MNASSGRQRPATWIEDGEKFVLIGLKIKLDGQNVGGQIAPNFWALSDTTFSVPTHWRTWLGSMRADRVEECNLFLLSKLRSTTPDVLDEESERLSRRVQHWYYGLLLASTFASRHRPVILKGYRLNGEISIRQQMDLDNPITQVGFPSLDLEDIALAARLGQNLELLTTCPPNGGCWRLNRTLIVYLQTRSTTDHLDRIHQYCRCVEGLILPGPGNTKSQFKSRTELFIGPRHHNRMGHTYDVRSAAQPCL